MPPTSSGRLIKKLFWSKREESHQSSLQRRMINSLGPLPAMNLNPCSFSALHGAFVTCIFYVPKVPVFFKLLGHVSSHSYFESTLSISLPLGSWMLILSLCALKSWRWTFSECLSSSFAKWSLVQPLGPFTCIYGYQITHATMLAF